MRVALVLDYTPARMILHSKLVEQAIDRAHQGRFVKDLVLVNGTAPIALVRKRRANPQAATEPGNLPEAAATSTRGAVLLVHGYGQNRYAFHLPARSMANHLAHAGFDVFNIDLRGHGRSGHFGSERPRRVHDFVLQDIPAALAEVRELSGHPKVFLVGHSLGGLCSYAVAARQSQHVAGVCSIGSPYHFTRGARLLAGLGSAFVLLDRVLDLPNYPVPSRLYGSFVRAGRRVVESPLYPVPLRGFRRGSMEPEVLEQHMALAMDRGSIATMRALVEEGRAQQRQLFGEAERFEALELPLLVIAGTHDDLAPPESVRPGHDCSRSPDRSYHELPFGHIDLLVGRDAPQLVWPLVTRWLEQHATRASHAEGASAGAAA